MSPLIRWQDIADIIMMSFLVYQLYGWFRSTKALQVVIGLGSLGVVYLITKNLGFFMTSWILQELGTVLFVLIIVIFQSEIRQALYRISPLRSIFGRQDPGHRFDMVELADAVFSLAASRTGAIIVFQRKEPIDEYLSNGIQVDATITGQLLGCIFKDGSPLHDGAVVIRNDRITRASCHLPLSTSSDIPQCFGTRHRAGLGLTERSDAVVLIVSEERGEVSLAFEGELQRIGSPEELSTQLAQRLCLPTQENVHISLGRRIVRNFWPKLATVVLVFACWLIITARQGEIVTMTVPIQFRNLPESLLLNKSSQDEVELQLRTITSLIPLPKEGEVVGEIDLSKIREGNNQILLRREYFRLPSGVMVSRIRPSALRITLERKIRKLVRVEPRIAEIPGERFRLNKFKVVPALVMIEGPESVLSRLETVRTEEIRLSSLDRTATVEARLELPPQLRPLYEDKVKVRIFPGR